MATLVIDIETIGKPWDSLDEATQHSLSRWINTKQSKTDYDTALDTVKDRLALSPFTATILSIAVYDLERKRGVVYLVAPEGSASSAETVQGFTIKHCTEKELLYDFWSGAASYDVFVTFAGRRFDVPFLLHRSAALGIQPSVELAKNKYLKLQSFPYVVDLQDELSFYSRDRSYLALQVCCAAYGIDTGKGQIDGAMVAALVRDQEYNQLVDYNAGDTFATAELYERWYQFLAPKSYKNTIEY
jgi:DNA polymerase elongation subunit (family B)